MSTIGIVGSSGFIGRSLSAYLSSRGHKIVEFNSGNPIIDQNRLSTRAEDLDNIIWAASRVNPALAKSRSDLVELELNEWKNFISVMRTESHEMSITFLSSGGCTYSSENTPFNESSDAVGVNEYGRLKVKMEKELVQSGLSYRIFRVSNVYGPGQPHGRGQGVIAEWVNAYSKKQTIKVFGSLKSFRDYIYIDDFCEGLLRAISMGVKEDTWNLGAGVPTDLEEILSIFKELTGSSLEVMIEGGRSTDRSGYYLDISKIVKSLDWAPKVPIRLGLQQILVSYGGLLGY
jgi:UDP-glucose 4-epimerase